MKMNAWEISPSRWEALFAQWGESPFRVRQALTAVWKRELTCFADATDLPLSLRRCLDETVEIPPCPEPDVWQQDPDGTHKALFIFSDRVEIESVAIPRDDRLTFCLSTQAGCAMGCRFCATARLGFVRNLTTAEILGQVLGMSTALGRKPTNLVFMGMGEPLANLDAVRDALDILCHPAAWNWSELKSTVSTCGWLPGLEEITRHPLKAKLAVSLNAPTDVLRADLMPVNRRFPLPRLLDAVRGYTAVRPETVSVEYILFAGINDRPEHARILARLLGNLRAKVNLIPFNPFPGTGFRRPEPRVVEAFALELRRGGLLTTLRSSRGGSIAAACGQLAGTAARRAA